ncbi:TPA: hypothetical protein ACIU94_004949, partial [Salmonella enterica subsp. enterica serovar Stanley]
FSFFTDNFRSLLNQSTKREKSDTQEREAPFLTDLLNQPFTLFVHSVDKWFCPLFLLSSGLPYQGFEMSL